MIPALFKVEPRTPGQLKRLREIERAFHVRAFGEELARVNLDMTEAERIKYIGWMRRLAAQHGVKPGVNAEYEWMKRVEDEVEASES
jgi:hypothetical protein